MAVVQAQVQVDDQDPIASQSAVPALERSPSMKELY